MLNLEIEQSHEKYSLCFITSNIDHYVSSDKQNDDTHC
jgi:hypothetical protein